MFMLQFIKFLHVGCKVLSWEWNEVEQEVLIQGALFCIVSLFFKKYYNIPRKMDQLNTFLYYLQLKAIDVKLISWFHETNLGKQILLIRTCNINSNIQGRKQFDPYSGSSSKTHHRNRKKGD